MKLGQAQLGQCKLGGLRVRSSATVVAPLGGGMASALGGRRRPSHPPRPTPKTIVPRGLAVRVRVGVPTLTQPIDGPDDELILALLL